MYWLSGRNHATWHPERDIMSAYSLGMLSVPKASSSTFTPTPARPRSARASARSIGASISTRTLSAPVVYRSREEHCTPPSPCSRWRIVCSLGSQHTVMLEGMLLMLLSLGGGKAPSPAATVPAATTADTVVGVWRGTWAAQDAEDRVPVEAILTAPSKEGQMLALLATGA